MRTSATQRALLLAGSRALRITQNLQPQGCMLAAVQTHPMQCVSCFMGVNSTVQACSAPMRQASCEPPVSVFTA